MIIRGRPNDSRNVKDGTALLHVVTTTLLVFLLHATLLTGIIPSLRVYGA